MSRTTSKEVASAAARILADPDSTPEARKVAGSALAQVTDEPVAPAEPPRPSLVSGLARPRLHGLAANSQVIEETQDRHR
jgi:hypothetical protein